MTLLYRLPPQWISVLAYLIPRVMYVVAIILRPSCLNPTHGKVYSIELYIIKFVSDLRKVIVFSAYSGFFHNKTDCHDISEIFLKLALNTITLTI